jgi:4-hydroxy 2-oxovalerate aldolase
MKNITLLDCTLRDGGYLNSWDFDKSFVRQYLLAASRAGIDIIEIGWRGTEEYFSREEYGIWRFSEDDLIREVTRGMSIPKIAVMCNYGMINESDFVNKDESPISLIRLVCDSEVIHSGIELLQKLKDKGYEVSLNATGFSNYSDDDISDLVETLKNSKLDYFYIADTYGSMMPDDISRLMSPFLEIDNLKIGFHPHNSFQMAFANTIEAIKLGVNAIDASIYGMGRGAGNLPTEIIVTYLQEQFSDKYNVISLLSFIDLYMMPIYKKIQWGYSIPYLLSGFFKCHPYFIRDINDYSKYTINETWQILNKVNQKNPSTYVKGMVSDIIQNDNIGSVTKEYAANFTKKYARIPSMSRYRGNSKNRTIDYKDRHIERNFLVLANGKSLKKYKDKIDKYIEKYDPVILGANYLGGLFSPDYHAFTLSKRLVSYAKTINKNSKLLLGEYMPEELIETHIKREYEHILYEDILGPDFMINNGIISSNCRTISTLLLGVAVIMGAKRVHVVGMDGYRNQNEELSSDLFYQESEKVSNKDVLADLNKWSHFYIKSISDYLMNKGGDGVIIMTPTSYSDFYKGIDNYIES